MSPKHSPDSAASHRPPSASDVAERAGVSRSAVSRTFTQGSSVSAETRAKVLKAAQELNYHVNHLARGLSKQESRPVCILVSTLRKPYHARLLDEITRKLQEQGRVTILINVGDDPENATKALEQTLNYRASVTIVLSGSPPSEMVRKCVDVGQKVILVNRSEDIEGAHHIRIDYQSAMENAAAMFERAGCKNVAIVTRKRGTPSLRAREQALADALAKSRIETTRWMGDSTTYEAGQRAGRELLSGRQAPQGVFCTTDLMACGFMDAARVDFGIRIPSDLCVLGFDDIPQADWASYGLTTFSQPYGEIGETISAILQVDSFPADPHTLLYARPVWRQSIRANSSD